MAGGAGNKSLKAIVVTMEHLFTSESLISFLILIVLEVVLGIDNVIFVSIIMNRLPVKDQKKSKTILDDYRNYYA